ncbi:MAG: tRNA 2-thiocytidine(32) synthetase TtcA [Bacteriovorax sp.]|nr:tRNA 2-thiocytidine(32) synthetase TtcA [Bacteriovorax sp.]
MNEINIDTPLAIKVRKQITRALSEYHMIAPDDHIMVGVSGGKDSTVLTLLLKEIQKKAPMNFSFEAVMLDQKQPGFDVQAFKAFMAEQQIKLTILEEDTYSIVKEKTAVGGTYCSLCSRLRRGILYNYAHQNNFTKIALGHHRDDMIQTFMLNIFYSGKLGSMPPKLYSKDHRNIVIRPLAFVAENDIIELANLWQFPIIPCNLCGSQEGLKRVKMKTILDELEKEIPDIRRSMANALGNIELSHLLDKNLFDFTSELRPDEGVVLSEGSISAVL